MSGPYRMETDEEAEKRDAGRTDGAASGERTVSGKYIFRKTSGEPLEEAIAREFSGELTKAVRRLSEKHRLVIVLYYYDELSVHEIAKITGCLEGTVKSRLHFARRQLKKMLSDAGEEETGRIIYERG